MWRGCRRWLERRNGRRGGGYGRDRYRDGISRWEDNVAHLTLWMESNAPLAYAPVLELHHLITSTLGDLRVRLEREET